MNFESQRRMLLECLCEISPDRISPKDLGEYINRRKQLIATVRHVAMQKGYRVLGSWQSGQFHLSVSRSYTESDVDAWSGGITGHRAETLVVQTHEDYLHLRLSLHSDNYQKTLSLRAQKVIALLNICAAKEAPRLVHSYVTYKSFLVMRRLSPDETYADVARRSGTAGMTALGIKLGLLEGADCMSFQEVKSALVAGISDLTSLERVDLERDSSKIRAVALGMLREHQLRIGPAFRDYLIEKYSN